VVLTFASSEYLTDYSEPKQPAKFGNLDMPGPVAQEYVGPSFPGGPYSWMG
jgi:hypothetical protein